VCVCVQRTRRRLTSPRSRRHLNASPELRSQLAAGAACALSASPTHKGAMDPRLLAFEAARRQFVDGDATAAARDLAHAFGAVHPEAGTLRAIHAVIDQLDNPSSFARNRDAYEKHGASQGTFNRWKKKLTAFVVEEEVEIGTVAVEEALDADLLAALVSWP
jgi:hypothetical protein